jgi:GNAT superfamily N-acetyltransferase
MDPTTIPRVGTIEVPSTCAEGTSGAEPTSLPVVPATRPEAPQVVEVVRAAFLEDPTWSWAFPDPGARLRWWTLCIEQALRYPWVLRSAGYEAVSIWIPPDGTEFSSEAEARLPDLLAALAGARAPEVTELLGRFAKAHPRHIPHHYLSLLATADQHRGRGLGIALLRENLARIDLEGSPAYLESSNPRNDPRYQALGFVPVSRFQAPGGGPVVTGMWRQGRSRASPPPPNLTVS